MVQRSKIVNEWLKIARRDLSDAKTLWQYKALESAPTIAFLCQQSAEKILKAFLAQNQISFSKTHDLEVLGQIILRVDEEAKPLLLEAIILNPYAVEFRYPDATAKNLIESDITTAIQLAEKINLYFLNKLNKE